MMNLPSITPAEIAVIGAAVFVLYIVPFVLLKIEDRKRRRSQIWPLESTAAPIVAELPPLPTDSREQEPLLSPAVDENAGAIPVPMPSAEREERVAEAPASESPAPPPLEASQAIPADGNGAPEARFELYEGATGYQFRLEDLRRVRPADCQDVADDRSLLDVERMAAGHRGGISSVVLCSPYPVRSACLIGAAQEHASLNLRYLLFPSLWPVSADEAVAQAVFDIDTTTGTVSPRVEARPQADLSEHSRRAIRDNGGQV